MPAIDFNPAPKFVQPERLQHPTIPRPMFGTAPRVVLGQEWWDVEREAAYKKNNYCCWACGDNSALQAHEVYTIDYERATMTYVEASALCIPCHTFIHIGRAGVLIAKHELSELEFKRIVRTRYKLLKDAGLKANWAFYSTLESLTKSFLLNPTMWTREIMVDAVPPPLVPDKPWDVWRLVIGDRLYPPRYKNAFEARVAYGMEEE